MERNFLDTVSIVLFLLLAVVVSGAISRMLPISLPTPLVQILLGAGIGLSTSYRVELDPELFLLLFLPRSEEHTSELQSLMRISYAVFCLKKKKNSNPYTIYKYITDESYK